MKPSTFRLLVLTAAVSAPGLLHAQFQVDNGRANDANNRIGSGGYNSGGVPAPETVGGNQIVTGNVTGGRSFRGDPGYSSAREFRGVTSGDASDRFIRDSSGAPVGYGATPRNFSTNVMPFYGESRTVNPPPDFVSIPGGGGYVPSVSTRRFQSTRFDERLGVLTDADSVLPRPGQLVLPGPVDNASNQTFISASPLYGIRQFNVGDPGAAAMSSGGRRGLSDEQVIRMRQELAPTLNTPDLTSGPLDPSRRTTGDAAGTDGTTAPGQTRSLTAPTPAPFDAPENQSLSSPSLQGNAFGSNPNDLSTQQGQRQRMLASPVQQSSQYAEMRRRLDRYNAERPKTDADLNRDFRNQFRAAEEQQKQAGGQQTPAPRGQPTGRQPAAESTPDLAQRARDAAFGERKPGQLAPGTEMQQLPASPLPGPAGRPEPVEVKSLAAGVGAPGLRGLLAQAEQFMQQGKFDSAITQYESAAQVAPNNPLILLGQANAELGGEYFARAENHLRQAFLLDPALLMARYDLRAMMGDERLQKVIESLKDIARRETSQSRPAFLLAYVAYNTRDSARAASYLDLAEQRTAGPDPVFRILRSHWNLPAGGSPTTRPAADLNK